MNNAKNVFNKNTVLYQRQVLNQSFEVAISTDMKSSNASD